MAPRVSSYKIVIAGHIVEAFQYANPIGYGLLADKREAPYRARRSLDEQQITESSLSRTRNRLLRLINANSRMYTKDEHIIQPQFLTYTFKENLQNITVANHLYTNYIKRLNYTTFNTKKSTARYVVVPEFQERGAVHYHAIFFNLPPINARHEFNTGAFAETWEHGFIKTKKITDVPNVGLYMTKYMTKDVTDRRLVGKKKYFSSRGLLKPIVITYEHLADEIMNFLAPIKPLHAYMTKERDAQNFPANNPTFCATYNLTSEQLREMQSFYSLTV